MTGVCRFLDRARYSEAEAVRMALAKRRGNDAEWKRANNAAYGWATFHEVVGPCVMWFLHWYFDPDDPKDRLKREAALGAIASNTFGVEGNHYYLSRFYWQDWSHLRPPISVLCPNGDEWCVDSKAHNGEGWKVIGDPPLLTCTPSIQTKGYHGYLINGIFKDC